VDAGRLRAAGGTLVTRITASSRDRYRVCSEAEYLIDDGEGSRVWDPGAGDGGKGRGNGGSRALAAFLALTIVALSAWIVASLRTRPASSQAMAPSERRPSASAGRLRLRVTDRSPAGGRVFARARDYERRARPPAGRAPVAVASFDSVEPPRPVSSQAREFGFEGPR
jgi:hypothetical protein